MSSSDQSNAFWNVMWLFNLNSLLPLSILFSTPILRPQLYDKKSFLCIRRVVLLNNPNSLEIKNLYKMVHFTLIPLFVWKLLQNFIISSGYNRYVYQGSPDSRPVLKHTSCSQLFSLVWGIFIRAHILSKVYNMHIMEIKGILDLPVKVF